MHIQGLLRPSCSHLFFLFSALLTILPSMAQGQSEQAASELFKRVREGDRVALATLQGAAESGDVHSQFQLGRAYSFGSTILVRNDTMAAQWVEKAAQSGHPEAQSNMGYLFSVGLGVPRDSLKAMSWWQRSAEAGFAPAQLNLGIAFQQGKITPKDDAAAFLWMSRAAAQGLAVAQLNLGMMHGRGIGTKKDDQEALAWYRRAADQGNEIAMTNVGSMYANGEGVAKNPAEALRWLRKPVASGESRAIAIYDQICIEHAAICGRDTHSGYFAFEMPTPRLKIVIPDAPQMGMKPHPLAELQSHARFMGEGPGGYSISILLPTADAGMTPLDCARSTSSSLVQRYGLKREDVVTRRTSETTFVMLFPVKSGPLVQLKAYLMSGYDGTHCVEVHLSKTVVSESEFASWSKGFGRARIEKY